MEPMNINEAIEAMKIVVPYLPQMRSAKDGVGLVRGLLKATADANEHENVGRLLALMEHKTLDEVSERMAGDEGKRMALFDLVQCINANPIPDLVDGARILGLSAQGWTDDKQPG